MTGISNILLISHSCIALMCPVLINDIRILYFISLEEQKSMSRFQLKTAESTVHIIMFETHSYTSIKNYVFLAP